MATEEDMDSHQIAADAVSTWRDIDAALVPIIGQRGVMGLYKRSLNLTRADYAWLAPVEEASVEPGDFATLQQALSRQASPIAAAASTAMLQTFHRLLTNLIGLSLATQLLQSVRGCPPGSQTAQDVSK